MTTEPWPVAPPVTCTVNMVSHMMIMVAPYVNVAPMSELLRFYLDDLTMYVAPSSVIWSVNMVLCMMTGVVRCVNASCLPKKNVEILCV